LKHLVNELHRQGFAVVMDVVYNHVGWPNVFSMLDRKYYFRLNPDWTYSNYSACGNDVRTEAPMMRRLIVDNILYWMEEFHIDGFRFDLAELIDMETMFEIRDKARKLNPNVLLISEPWSHRGWDKKRLTGTEWSAWNNDFRYAVKDFVQGHHKRDQLKKTIFGSLENWAADPLQPVNYAESHDDMALVDEISLDPGKDGSNPTPDDAARNRLTATVLFTSLGIPMIAEGQEFLRSKFGIENTFSEGDRVNALRWDDRDRPPARDTLDYYAGLIHLRTSRQGAAFRLADKPSPGYYRWIMPQNPHALGYVVNDPQQHAGASFIVLLNADDAPVDFSVPFPGGQWRLVGNGDRIMAEGFPGEEIQGSVTKNIQVPRLSSRIFMREEKKHERI
jgi:pullulanase/glycogen debranching enzyme